MIDRAAMVASVRTLRTPKRKRRTTPRKQHRPNLQGIDDQHLPKQLQTCLQEGKKHPRVWRTQRYMPIIFGPINYCQRVLNQEALTVDKQSWPTLPPRRQEILEQEVRRQLANGVPSLLLEYPLEHRCMVWDERKVRATKHLSASTKTSKGKKYLDVCLGTDSRGRQVWIGAHVLVAWAFHGPSASQEEWTLIEHTCHNSRCINGLHLRPGNNRTNHYSRRR